MNSSSAAGLTTPRTRRDAMRASGALAAALMSGSFGHAAAQGATPTADGAGSGAVFIQGFGSGSLFRTQGDGPDLPPYTLYLWEADDPVPFVSARGEQMVGLLGVDQFLAALGAGQTDVTAVLAALPAAAAGGSEPTEFVRVLQLTVAQRGSDPGSMTFQGDIVPTPGLVGRGGATPAAEPVEAENVERGYLFVTVAGDLSLNADADVRVPLP